MTFRHNIVKAEGQRTVLIYKSTFLQMAQLGKNLVAVFAGAAGVYFFREYVAGGVCQSTTRLDGKTVIITGCNR